MEKAVFRIIITHPWLHNNVLKFHQFTDLFPIHHGPFISLHDRHIAGLMNVSRGGVNIFLIQSRLFLEDDIFIQRLSFGSEAFE